MAAKDRVSQLFEVADGLQKEYEGILELRAENRTLLRGMAGQGILTDEEAARVEELYPRRAKADAEGEAASEPVAA